MTNVEHEELINWRSTLVQQRNDLDVEIKRLSERIDLANEKRFAPIRQARQAREKAAIEEAKRTGKAVVYIDDDGCEVSCSPSGHSFYNAADWY